jgi:tetratricopeptide (TPR) repeat protein
VPFPAEQSEPDQSQSDDLETDLAQKREATLTRLFESLAEADSPEMAHGIEQLIWTLWLQTDNERAKAFMSIALQSLNEQDLASARLFLDRAIEAEPDYAEAWNKRATLSFIEGDYASSLADIARVLELEPRHFGALNGLGMIMEGMGRKKEALEAFRRALAIYPQMTLIQERVEALQREVEGPEL